MKILDGHSNPQVFVGCLEASLRAPVLELFFKQSNTPQEVLIMSGLGISAATPQLVDREPLDSQLSTKRVATPRLQDQQQIQSDDDKVCNGRCWKVLKIVGIVAAAIIGALALAALVVGIVAMVWPAFAATIAGAVGSALTFVAANALPFVIAGAAGLAVTGAITAGLIIAKKECVDEEKNKTNEEKDTSTQPPLDESTAGQGLKSVSSSSESDSEGDDYDTQGNS